MVYNVWKQHWKRALSIAAGKLRKREGIISPSWRSAPSGADNAEAHKLRGDDRGPFTHWAFTFAKRAHKRKGNRSRCISRKTRARANYTCMPCRGRRRAAPRCTARCPSEKTKTSNAIRIILFLTARETVTVNSLLEESNPTGIGVNVQGVTFQNVDIAVSS